MESTLTKITDHFAVEEIRAAFVIRRLIAQVQEFFGEQDAVDQPDLRMVKQETLCCGTNFP